MNRMNRAVLAAVVAGSMLTGGLAGAATFAATVGASAASTSSTSTATTPGTPSAPNPPSGANAAPGKFVSNEDPTHEQGESAAREAQENAGQMPTVP